MLVNGESRSLRFGTLCVWLRARVRAPLEVARTPLHLAAANGRQEACSIESALLGCNCLQAVSLLLDARAEPDVLDRAFAALAHIFGRAFRHQCAWVRSWPKSALLCRLREPP